MVAKPKQPRWQEGNSVRTAAPLGASKTFPLLLNRNFFCGESPTGTRKIKRVKFDIPLLTELNCRVTGVVICNCPQTSSLTSERAPSMRTLSADAYTKIKCTKLLYALDETSRLRSGLSQRVVFNLGPVRKKQKQKFSIGLAPTHDANSFSLAPPPNLSLCARLST